MIEQSTLDFLTDLKENNTREWFITNKDQYELAKRNVEILISQIVTELSTFEKDLGTIDPKKCLFRIYRDIRFSPDKTPYKTYFAATFRRNRQEKASGYYLHIEPGNSFISCGQYVLDPKRLKKIRKEIYNDYETLVSILNECQLKKEFGDLTFEESEMLQRVPSGFDKNHPAAIYTKLKHFYVHKNISDKVVLKNDFARYVRNMFKIVKPLNDYFHDILINDF